MSIREWKVVDKKFVRANGGTMEASCHHRRSGACGGCYARMAEALEEILVSEDPKAVVKAVHDAMIAEGKK